MAKGDFLVYNGASGTVEGSIRSGMKNSVMMYVIEARGVYKHFGTGEARVEALRGVDLAVARGEFVAIMGPSGSGKSTLLHVLLGIEPPSQGKILLDGEDLAHLNDTQRTLLRRRLIGFVFQSFNLLPSVTAEENVALPLLLDGVAPAEARRRAGESLELVGLARRRSHLPGKLSGGEQQRVAIARALAIKPVVLLADEPTGSLDSANGQRVMQLLRHLVDSLRQTIVLITHDPAVARQADHTLHLRDGILQSDGLPGVSSAGSHGDGQEAS
jgi:putative ABC transport system ATP-binding protein